MSNEMYREDILDLYKNPMNFGKLETSNCAYKKNNLLCGDSIKVMLDVKDNKITDVKFDGIGCAISIASASLITEAIKGMDISEILELEPEFVLELIGMDISSGRKKCMFIAFDAIKGAIIEYRNAWN